MESNLKEHIKGLPDDCRLIPVNGKVPTESDWRNNTYNPDEICKIKKTGIGILQGEKGGGLVFVDNDGEGAPESFKYKIGQDIKELPKTFSWTSDTPHRYQLMLRVPEKWWSLIKKMVRMAATLLVKNCS